MPFDLDVPPVISTQPTPGEPINTWPTPERLPAAVGRQIDVERSRLRVRRGDAHRAGPLVTR
jgi:hypothetical protein